MSKARHGDRRKMELNQELRELAQDPDVALYMVAYLTSYMTVNQLTELVEGARLAGAKLF